jgi:hypothetical protein
VQAYFLLLSFSLWIQKAVHTCCAYPLCAALGDHRAGPRWSIGICFARCCVHGTNAVHIISLAQQLLHMRCPDSVFTGVRVRASQKREIPKGRPCGAGGVRLTCSLGFIVLDYKRHVHWTTCLTILTRSPTSLSFSTVIISKQDGVVRTHPPHADLVLTSAANTHTYTCTLQETRVHASDTRAPGGRVHAADLRCGCAARPAFAAAGRGDGYGRDG